MTTGRCENFSLIKAATNGQAGEAMPEKESASPFSNRRARDCTAGVFEISANKLLAARVTEFCAKRKESRSRNGFRQAGQAALFFNLPLIAHLLGKPDKYLFAEADDFLPPGHPNQGKAQQVKGDVDAVMDG
jgi:hypothetical protein